MATQHPDNASAPFWQKRAFVSTADEINESLIVWQKLGCEELKWDWEGKLTEETILERLLTHHFEYFQKAALGRDHFLTYRVPQPQGEKGGRYWRALTSMVSASMLAHDLHLPTAPVFEAILPMTKTSQDLISLHSDLQKLTTFLSKRSYQPQVIPLVEDVSHLLRFGDLFAEYSRWYQKQFNHKLSYFRPYIARSDPALQSGLVAAVLASKVAIHQLHQQGKKLGIPVFPIIGMGSLPFRGGLSPVTVDQLVAEYQGVATFTIQSAFRYDYGLSQVTASIKKINTSTFSPPPVISKSELTTIASSMAIAEQWYQQSLTAVAPLIYKVAPFIPKRRERFTHHHSPLQYQRQNGHLTLPRAITFTAALYSLGIPPEFIGTGQAVTEIAKLKGGQLVLEKFYPSLTAHLQAAGGYLNKKNLQLLMALYPQLQVIVESVELVEKMVGYQWNKSASHLQHDQLTSDILQLMIKQSGPKPTVQTEKKIRKLIDQAAILRHSIG